MIPSTQMANLNSREVNRVDPTKLIWMQDHPTVSAWFHMEPSSNFSILIAEFKATLFSFYSIIQILIVMLALT